jgi:cytoskeletal protein CcmA (bactofilin family)
MSFRQFGGLQFASKHNAVASYYNTSNNLIVTQNVGQPNSYINFLSDISGNISIYGNLDVSGNIHVSGDVDISKNLHVQEDIDCSGNLHVSGDIDCSGNIDVSGDIDCSGNITANEFYITGPIVQALNSVVPKSYVDSVANGLTPLPFCVLCKNDASFNSWPPSGTSYTIDDIQLNPTFDGSAVLINAQGGPGVPDINNGIYIVSANQWQRASYLTTGDKATGTATFILQGTTYSNYRFVCTTGTDASAAYIDASAVLWSPFDIPFSLGQGLIKTVNNNNTVISVDPSLNFIQYLDNSGNTLNIGNYANNINIGKVSSGNNKICVTQNGVGINNNSPQYALDVSGNLRTTMDASINSITVGRGGGSVVTNTAIGVDTLKSNISSSQQNTAIGYRALYSNSIGYYNTAVGTNALYSNSSGYYNTAVGTDSLYQNNGINNTSFGYTAGYYNSGSYNTFLGCQATSNQGVIYNNSTALGYNAIIDASNQIVLGGNSSGSYPSVKIPGSYLGIGGVYNPSPGFALDVSGNTNVSGISYFNTKQFTPWPPTPYEICTNAPIQIKSFYDQYDKLILTSDPSNNSAGTIQYIWDSDTSSNILYRQLQLNPYGGSVFINKLTPDPYTNSFALDVSGCINSSSADSQSFIAFQNNYLGTTYFYGMGTITSALCFSANRPLNSNTPQMVLTSDGNVGIGTTAPAYRLDVSGNMRINNPLSGYNGLTINQDPAGYALNILKYTDPSSNSTGGFLIGGSGSYNPTTQPNDFTIVASGPITSPPIQSTVNGEDTGVMNLTVWSAVKNGLRLTYTTATLTETGSIFLNAPYVAVGKSLGSGYALDVSGNVNATSYNTPSDYRIKENVTQIDSTFVDKLNPVTYLNTKSGKQDIGLIAHELQEIYPELVNGEKDGEQFQSVNYIGLIPVLIKEIQDLKKEIILVKTELNELKNK